MFVILAHRRSGTHMLASLLNSHPELRCYDEVLLSRKWHLRLGRKNIVELKEKEGCIVMYRHFLLRADSKIQNLICNSHVIHLMRKNLDNHALSLANMKPHPREDLNYRKEQIVRVRNKIFANRKFRFPNLFKIYYEDICGDKDIKSYDNPDLLEFLGVKSQTLTTTFTKGVDP